VDVLLTFNKSSIEKEEAESRRESEEIPDMKNIQAFREFLIRKYSKADESKSKQMTVVFKQNVLVLGVGDQYLGAESSRKADNYSHITLLVSLLGAQEVIHAQTMGSLSFVLRNDADVEQKVITPSNNETVFRSAITASVARQESTEESEEK
jgi:Flp pilus assembly protein CpaB